MSYNSKFICTYNYYDPSLTNTIEKSKLNLEDCEDLEDMSDYLYKTELLQIFGCKEFDSSVIDGVISEIFLKLSLHDELKECMRIVASHFLSEDLDVGFTALFSYNFMFLTHRCICDFLETGNISEENMNTLKIAVTK
uniref:Uncharacterized protein n=1 Tax=viral metagenome TaxID=1070528 RepID=A0A6C0HYW5_9ZZZZ